MLLTFPATDLAPVLEGAKSCTLRLTGFPHRFPGYPGRLIRLQFGSYSQPAGILEARVVEQRVVDLLPVWQAADAAGLPYEVGECVPFEVALEHPALVRFELFRHVCRVSANHPYVVLHEAKAKTARWAVLVAWQLER